LVVFSVLSFPAPGFSQTLGDNRIFDLSSPVLRTLGDLQEDWLNWLAAYYREDEEPASVALASLLEGARELGMSRLPQLSLGAAAAAARLADQGNFDKAWQGIEAARRLDPSLPDVEFAAAQVARLEGAYFGAVKYWLRGHSRLFRVPLQRSLWLSDLALWMLSAFLLTGVAFVVLEVATRGDRLLGDLVGFLERLLPQPVAYAGALVFLVWPILLPSGALWLAVYWSLLIWGYGSWSERTVLIGLWILLGGTPVLVNELRHRAGVALTPEIRMVESLGLRRLEGAVFSDLATLRTALPESTAVTHLQADINLALGQRETALDLYLDVLRAEPENSSALSDTGVCYFQRGDFDEAIDFFQRASQDESASAVAYFNLSQTYSELYRFEDAGRALSTAQEIDNESVGGWIEGSAEERVVSLAGGIARTGEIRAQFFEFWRSDQVGVDWGALWRGSLSLPLAVVFMLAAVATQFVRRRSRGGSHSVARWWRGTPDFLRRVLLPGLAEAEGERWVWSFVALLGPVTMVTLPFLSHFSYAIPWGFGPGRATSWLVAGIGLFLYFLIRFLWQLRDGT
jgi:tetratricopeptide (TPR) repeat protein